LSDAVYLPRDAADELEFLADGDDILGFRHVAKQHLDNTRWQAHYLVVIKRVSDGTLWGASYGEGLTEYQDDDGFENTADGMVEFRPVRTEEVVTHVYRLVK
jgi:hypothetical protein